MFLITKNITSEGYYCNAEVIWNQITCEETGKKARLIVPPCVIVCENRGNRRDRLKELRWVTAMGLYSRDHPYLTFGCWAACCEGAMCGFCKAVVWLDWKKVVAQHIQFQHCFEKTHWEYRLSLQWSRTSCHHFSLPPDCHCRVPQTTSVDFSQRFLKPI